MTDARHLASPRPVEELPLPPRCVTCDAYGAFAAAFAQKIRAVHELLAWSRKVSSVRPIVEAAWVEEALATGRMPDLGEHRKHIV